jgi:hypothetical protein
MSTKLTKERRAAIIESVIAGTLIPKQKVEIITDTSKRIHEVLMSRVPKDFLAATANMPKEWFSHITSAYIRNEVNPAWLMQHDREINYYYRNSNVRIEGVRKPQNMRDDGNIYDLMKGRPKEEQADTWEAYLDKQITAAKQLAEKEDKLRSELSGFLQSVKTYAEVIDKMPELERHLPRVPAKEYPIAVSTAPLVKTLTGLGFDQSAPA